MDVRNWPIDKVMQLPDHCFGQRWPVVFAHPVAGSGTVMYIHDLGLPERMVLWELSWGCGVIASLAEPLCMVALYLSDQLPAAAADLAAQEPVFKQQGNLVAGVHYLQIPMFYRVTMKLPLQPGGRRFAIVVQDQSGESSDWTLSLVISSFPTEVPDCLLSV